MTFFRRKLALLFHMIQAVGRPLPCVCVWGWFWGEAEKCRQASKKRGRGVGSGGGADSGIEASHPPGETTTPQPGNISPYVVWLWSYTQKPLHKNLDALLLHLQLQGLWLWLVSHVYSGLCIVGLISRWGSLTSVPYGHFYINNIIIYNRLSIHVLWNLYILY